MDTSNSFSGIRTAADSYDAFSFISTSPLLLYGLLLRKRAFKNYKLRRDPLPRFSTVEWFSDLRMEGKVYKPEEIFREYSQN
jgi:hypothetical protein